MTDQDIEILATEYAKKCDPLNQTLEKQADIRQGFIEGYKRALNFGNEIIVCTCKTPSPDIMYGTYCAICGFDLPNKKIYQGYSMLNGNIIHHFKPD